MPGNALTMSPQTTRSENVVSNIGDLLLVAIRDYDPALGYEGLTPEASRSAPDVSVQLTFHKGQCFCVFGNQLGWWIHVKALDTQTVGFIPSSHVVPVKNNVKREE